MGIFLSICLSIASRAAFYYTEFQFSKTLNIGFALQGNLILFIYLLWKGFQIYLLNYQQYALDYGSFLSPAIATTIITVGKIHGLFSFEVLQVVSNFKEMVEGYSE